MKNSLVPILALLALLLGGLSYYQWKTASATATALNDATTERDGLRERVADLEKRERKLRDEAAAPRPVPPSTGSRDMVFRSGGVGGPGGSGGMPAPMLALESPEMRRLMAVGQKGQLDKRYAALFKSLDLPPPQLEKFKQLLIDKQSSAMDVMAAARSQGMLTPDSRGQIQALMQQASREVDDGIKNLIGEAGFQQYQQFDRTQAQRSIVDQLASRLSYSDSPLTPQQSEKLIQVLVDTAPPVPATPNGPGGGDVAFGGGMRVATFVGGPGVGGGAINIATGGSGASITPEAVAQAQSLLNPTQLGALQQIQAEQQAQQQMGDLMRQSIQSQGGTGRIMFSPADATAAPPPPPPGG